MTPDATYICGDCELEVDWRTLERLMPSGISLTPGFVPCPRVDCPGALQPVPAVALEEDASLLARLNRMDDELTAHGIDLTICEDRLNVHADQVSELMDSIKDLRIDRVTEAKRDERAAAFARGAGWPEQPPEPSLPENDAANLAALYAWTAPERWASVSTDDAAANARVATMLSHLQSLVRIAWNGGVVPKPGQVEDDHES